MAFPRAWKNAEEAAAAARDFLAASPPRRAAIRGLMADLLEGDPPARKRAADVARRVCERDPAILRKYADVLIDLAAEIPLDEWQARVYVTLAAALSAPTHSQRMRLTVPVRALIAEERIALRAAGLEAFAMLAAVEPQLRDEALELLEHARHDTTPGIKARSRRMLLLLMSSRIT